MTPRNRKLAVLLVFLAISLVPALAFAGDTIDGSDTGEFSRSLSQGLLVALGGCFLTGLGMSMTPCVWPMIPITVSIFGATESKSRLRGAALSATFVLGLCVFFGAVGIAAASSGHAVGGFLRSQYVRIGIAVLFTVLAASMFGAFEIALPSKLQNKLATVGGIGFKGAFILGLVMALIAAPCTTAFVVGLGTKVGETGNILLGFSTFFALALGMGVPFFVAGAFAVSLPKPGAWMLGIKWICGVALSYMALSYLREAFPAMGKLAQPGTLYGVIGALVLMAGAALGAVHIAAERRRSKFKHLSKPMKLASLIPAIAGAFMFVSWTQMESTTVIPSAIAAEGGMGVAAPAPEIQWETNEAAAIAKATAEHKPVLIDFGASWCTACKEYEHVTFPDPRVRAEGVRFVALKVDASDDDNAEVAAIGKKYKVDLSLLPAVVMLDSSGKEVVRYTEFVKPDRFSAAMQKVQ